MEQSNELKELISQLKENPPKIIGSYKKQGWAIKTLDKIGNESVEVEEDGTVTAKAVLESKDESYFPAFLHLDIHNEGQIIGVYLVAENEDQFDLIPFEIAKEFLGKDVNQLTPFKYRTLEKIEGDELQLNWPEFS